VTRNQMSENDVRSHPSLPTTELTQSSWQNAVRSDHRNRNSSPLPSYWSSARGVPSTLKVTYQYTCPPHVIYLHACNL